MNTVFVFRNPEFVDAAIAEFAAVYEKHKDETLLDSLVSAMYVRGKTEDAKKLLESENASPTRDMHLLLAIAVTESVDACVKRAAEMRPAGTQRQLLLEQLIFDAELLSRIPGGRGDCQQLAADSPQKEPCCGMRRDFAVSHDTSRRKSRRRTRLAW